MLFKLKFSTWVLIPNSGRLNKRKRDTGSPLRVLRVKRKPFIMEDRMKKLLLITLAALLVLPLAASYHKHWTMLGTAVGCAADTVITNGTEFASANVPIGKESYPRDCSVTITFTRAAGSASTVDFEFEVD